MGFNFVKSVSTEANFSKDNYTYVFITENPDPCIFGDRQLCNPSTPTKVKAERWINSVGEDVSPA
jgi:hypothetical protein